MMKTAEIEGEIQYVSLFYLYRQYLPQSYGSSSYYKHLNDNGTNYVQVESGGLGAYEGDKVSDNAVEVCKELNVDISNHIAHRLRGKDLIRGNFFVVMEPVHRQILVEAGVDPDQVYVLGYRKEFLTHIKRCGRIPQSKRPNYCLFCRFG